MRGTWLGGNQKPPEFDIYFLRDLVGWEKRDMIPVGTILMGMGRGRLLGYGLDGYGNCDLPRGRCHLFPIPMEIPLETCRGNTPKMSRG